MNLEQLGCPMDDFTEEKFLKEIDRKAPLELYHIIIMLKVLFAKKEAMPDFKDFDTDMFLQDDLVTPEYFSKLKLILSEFEKRNWIL